MCNRTRVDISATRHLGNGGCYCESSEDASGKLFASYFLRKEKNPLTHRRSSKYDVGQEIRTGTTESSDIGEVTIPKFSAGKTGTDLVHDGGGSILRR